MRMASDYPHAQTRRFRTPSRHYQTATPLADDDGAVPAGTGILAAGKAVESIKEVPCPVTTVYPRNSTPPPSTPSSNRGHCPHAPAVPDLADHPGSDGTAQLGRDPWASTKARVLHADQPRGPAWASSTSPNSTRTAPARPAAASPPPTCSAEPAGGRQPDRAGQRTLMAHLAYYQSAREAARRGRAGAQGYMRTCVPGSPAPGHCRLRPRRRNVLVA